MSVLHLGNTAGVAVELVRFLKKEGIVADVMSFHDEHTHSFFRSVAINLPVSMKDSFLKKSALLPLIISKSRNYNIVHLHSKFSQIGFLIRLWNALINVDKPIFVHFHGSDLRDLDSFGSFYRRFLLLSIKHSKKVLVSTPDLLHTLIEKVFKSREFVSKRFIFFRNPIDTSSFKPIKTKIDLHNGYDYVLFMPSAISFRKKGHHKVLKALELVLKLEKLNKKIKLVLVNTLSHTTDLKVMMRYIKARNLSKNIEIIPKIPKEYMPLFYNAADVVLDQFAINGVLGQIALEAMSCSRPVISWYSSKWDAYYGSRPPIFSAKSPASIAKAMVVLLQDANLRKKLGNLGREWVLKTHDAKAVVRMLINLYKEAL